MSTATRPTLTGPRASTLSRGCARQAYYEAIDAPRRPHTAQEERWFRRGHAVSNALRNEIVDELRADHQAPRRELEIPWPAKDPIGVGHADLYVPRDHRIVEITSTAGADLDAHKARQAAFYALEHPRAEEAMVISVDPSTFEDRAYPINPEAYEAEIRNLQQQLISGLRTGEPPARACQTPLDAIGYLCPFASTCFGDDWEWPVLDQALDPEVIDQVAELAGWDAIVRDERAQLKASEAGRAVTREWLAPRLPVDEEILVGDHRVKRTVSEVERFSLADCRKAGFELPEQLEAFVSKSVVERWYVKPVAK
jgi:hypothetical protein